MYDDRPSHPWNVFVRLQFQGEIARVCAHDALQIALHRHPLFTSLVEDSGRKLVWVPAAAELAQATWTTVRTTEAYPNVPALDIRKEIGTICSNSPRKVRDTAVSEIRITL
jgi:hypothetical protein